MHVEVSGRQFNFPPQCACCGSSSNSTFTVGASKSSGKRVVHTKTNTNTWDFPYCSRCLGHVQAAENADNTKSLIIKGSLTFAGVLFFMVAPWFGILVGIAGVVAAVMVHKNLVAQAQAMCAPQCACVLQSVAFLSWDGARQVFDIVSPKYALAFMVANQQKLVNVSPHARNLLEANGYGHQANKPQSARRYST